MKLPILAAALAFTASAAAQQFPKPTPPMQAIIDKDNARHFGDSPADPGPLATDLSPTLTPQNIDKAVKKVADWQLTVAQPYFDRIWTWSVLYTGFMAASDSTGDPKYRNAMLDMSRKFNFELRSGLPNADDQSVGSTYLELYLLQPPAQRDPKWIAPTRADLDTLYPLKTLKPNDPRIPWWWCDALFMAPAVWAEMSQATGDHKYVDYLNAQWHATYDLLYDHEEHLYARDATYKTKTEPNGKKMFWSRGEGWVFGGLARTLEHLPADDPNRAFYINQLKEMSEKIASLQDRQTGLWHAGLLDPATYPLDEVSGSALFIYGMAYGINHGYLDRAKYTPVITKAWKGILQNHIYADGRLGGIQQTGPEPAFYIPGASYTYGVGGFLLAGSELKKLATPAHTTSTPAKRPTKKKH
jgi:unsaturated rhamnogalacturonyl hydrolase